MAVRAWLNHRIVAARADQVAAERRGRAGHDECDSAAAEEMVCSLLKGGDAVNEQQTFAAALKALTDRGEHVWRGIYDDGRFDRNVWTYLRKLTKMTKTNEGFTNVRHYQ